MSVHLVGGGWSESKSPAVYDLFVAEAAERAESGSFDGAPRIAVIVVRDEDGDAHAAKLVDAASAAGAFEPVVTSLAFGETATSASLAGVHGIIVGGGLTPAYLASLTPIFGEIRRLVASGVPYLGFSAGASIASERALVGGWRIGGVEVSPEAGSEHLDEVTVENGIGLLDISVDVHAVQWGNLSRLIAATEAGLVDGGVAIDENTAFVVGEGALRVVGAGSVWQVLSTDGGVRVSSLAAG
ncbi:Type 1 glutamine amidotransferase-like domain-containing protein [Mycetocola zhujimingii]|uniref:Peptidase S51 n=1 Tax=Mycetocola zhujimingii TaxID=2079792 RepID=A0A2U1TEN5_9MICO|nr:Type 1 glutamine amidotransferase-like domain-containing protein [Mycetocola zhujimingii]PWC07367.1 peptidase S51 [Mycetocola zhujimingii]